MMGKMAVKLALVATLLAGLATSARSQPPLVGSQMHVESIGVIFANVGGPRRLPSAYVTIFDEFGSPVNGATVTGNWSGCNSLVGASGVTTTWYKPTGEVDVDGMAKVDGKKHSCWGQNPACFFVFTVTGVTKSGMTYDSSANVVSSGSCQCR